MIGLIGLGAMGGGYVSRLMDQKIDLLCCDAMPEARDRAREMGASVAHSLADFCACETVRDRLPRRLNDATFKAAGACVK